MLFEGELHARYETDLVDGLPGLGKTTTASWLASRLQSSQPVVNLYLESQPEHPTNVGGDLHPAGDVTGETFFQSYTPASFIQESPEKWQAFVRAASQTQAVSVFDSYPFQNSVRILLQMNAAPDLIQSYAGQLEAVVMPLQPVQVFYSHRDMTDAVRHFGHISAQRGQLWADYIAALVSRSSYAIARQLEGYSAVLAFVADYKQMTDWLLRQSRFPRIVLQDCSSDWDGCYQQIEAFLGL